MDNKMKDKLKEAGSFVLCAAVLLGIGYYTGILKGFTPQDFKTSYQKMEHNLSKKVQGGGARERILSSNNSTSQKSASYKNYRPRTIPETVLRGVYESNTWVNIFDSDKKAVFYLYDPTGSDQRLSEDFHFRMTNYLNNEDNRPYYNNFAITSSQFKNIKAGMIGPSKICNSLEECNNQRKSASDYSNMAEFFRRCGQTVCIINPYNNTYVILKDRNFASAVHTLDNLREW